MIIKMARQTTQKVQSYLKTGASKKALMSIRSIAFDLCSTSANRVQTAWQ